ncbi:MAG: hypothetical protein C0608_08095 [Deltaproteobacteria bacterium]|nr:MAG: hypothetical protein C0608_08095 [Deltaproteobacteria bacterium]
MIKGIFIAGAASFLFGLPSFSAVTVSNIPGYLYLMLTIIAGVIIGGIALEKARKMTEDKIVERVLRNKDEKLEGVERAA